MDGEKKDQTYQPMTLPICLLPGTLTPRREGKTNISLGYEVFLLCLGPEKSCINISQQTWVFILPTKEDLWTLLGLFTVNHVYTTKTLGKELGKEQKTFCIMLLKWLKRLLTLWWNITMTKDFLAGLTLKWYPLVLESSSINRVGLNNVTSGNLLPAPKNLGLGPNISQGPVVVIVTISFAIIIFYTGLCPTSFCYSHRKFTIRLYIL